MFRELIREFGGDDRPALSHVFGRTRATQEVITWPRMVGALVRALIRGPDRWRSLKFGLDFARIQAEVRREISRDRFRESRTVRRLGPSRLEVLGPSQPAAVRSRRRRRAGCRPRGRGSERQCAERGGGRVSEVETVRLAAVQPAVRLGEIEANLAHVEDLIRDAHREHGPDVITVPESMTTPNVYSRRMLDAARTVDGQPFQLLVRLARELDCVIGGGFIAARGGHTYGTYVLAEPDGSANLHDKDIPTAWEHNYYRGGDDDGVIDSARLGRIGLSCGWEWARNRTARRLRDGRVRLLLGGMCWPSFPTNWPQPLRDAVPS